jgi:hypothetical protein
MPGGQGSRVSLSPEPTQTLPLGTEVLIQVDKDAITAMVTVMLVGGPGKGVVKDCELRLTRADGQVLTGYIYPNQKVDEISLQGTKQTDRLEVFVDQYSGQRYKVIDRLLEFRTRG